MKSGSLQEAMREFYQILQAGEDLLQKPGTADTIIIEWASLLVETGIHMNMLQANSQASQCFTTALSLAATTDDKGIECLGRALSCLVNTHLHMRDSNSAEAIVAKYESTLETDPWGREVLADILLELGQGQLEQARCSSATTTLQKAYEIHMFLHPTLQSPAMAKVQSALGSCFLFSNDSRASNMLSRALVTWKALNFPPEEVIIILNTMKLFIEAEFKNKCFDSDKEVLSEMLKLHHRMSKFGLGMQVADTLTYLGTVAFHKENEKKATSYFEQSLLLHKQGPSTEESRDEIQKLLRFIGVACYNSRDFRKAARSYLECLQLLEQFYQPGNISKLGQIAECCASLGFTYSRLRDFDSMLQYYERALELKTRLAHEDLQLIETNIGSLYHVKAVKHEQSLEEMCAKRYYGLAENAFNRALRYSWKSFPYINYGYYLLCRGQYEEAAGVLQQGYLNGVIDKDTVEFDHTEDPILLDDLRLELEGREDIRMPAVIIALYLKTLAQVRMGNLVGAEHACSQLEQEVNSCPYATYYIEGYGEKRMKALSFSLLGYAFRSLEWHSQSLAAFHTATNILPDYQAALQNIHTQYDVLNKN